MSVWDLWGLESELTDLKSLTLRWITSGFIDSSQLTSTCNNQAFLGGPGLQLSTGYMERTYTDFAFHNIIYYSIHIAIGGNWQLTDTFSLYLDEVLIKEFFLSSALTKYGANICSGFSQKVLETYIVGKIYHVSDTITIKINWNSPGSGLSPSPFLAIKDITMSFRTKNSNDLEEVKVTLGKTDVEGSTDCVKGYFKDTTNGNVCTPCSSNCDNCFGSSPSQCYQTIWGKYFDGITSSPCSSNCGNCWGSGVNQCYHCSSPYMLSPDNTCVSSCALPYIPFGDGSAKQCIAPCKSDQFMLWNNTCVNSCEIPLISASSSQGQVCNYPCDQSVHSFLYWDGSCLSKCPYHQRKEDNYRFCDACQPGYYMYNDNTCLSTCKTGFKVTIIGESIFCLSYCKDAEYLHSDGLCRSECPETLRGRIGGSNFCKKESSEQKESIVKSVTVAQQVFGSVTSVCSNTISLINFANPTAILLSIMTNMLGNFRYLKIKYPSKLQSILDSNDNLSLNIIPDMPAKWAAKFPNSTLPENFQKYGFPSSFCVNFWNDELVLSLLTFTITIVCLSLLVSKRFKTIDSCLLNIKFALKWNFSLSLLLSYFGDIVLFSSFELRTNRLQNLYSIISYIVCIFMNSIVFLVIIRMIVVIRAVRANTIQVIPIIPNSHPSSNSAKWRSYEVLLGSFKDQSFLQQAFLLFSSIRIYVFYLIIAYPYEYPIFQMVVITLLNLTMALYLLIQRPTKGKLELIEYLFQESVMLAANLCVLILSILDQINLDTEDARDVIGDIIIWISTGFYSVGSVYLSTKLVIKIGYAIKILFKKYGKSSILPTEPNRTDTVNSVHVIENINRRENLHGRCSNPSNDSVNLHESRLPIPIIDSTLHSQINWQSSFISDSLDTGGQRKRNNLRRKQPKNPNAVVHNQINNEEEGISNKYTNNSSLFINNQNDTQSYGQSTNDKFSENLQIPSDMLTMANNTSYISNPTDGSPTQNNSLFEDNVEGRRRGVINRSPPRNLNRAMILERIRRMNDPRYFK